MKKINSTYIDNLVQRVINETLEGRADSLVSKIKTNVNELGGMDDGHPKFGKLNLSTMSDDDIADLMKQSMNGYDDEESEWDDEDEFEDEDNIDYGNSKYGSDFEEIDEDDMYEDSEVCECGGGIYEGECMECGTSYMEEGIHDEEDLNGDFDYVDEEDDTLEFEDDETEKEEENKEFCKYQKKMFGPDDERYTEKCLGKSAVKDLSRRPISMNERLKGNQSKIDKNKNGRIDAEDFKMLRGKKHETEIDEKLYGKQSKLDKNKNGRIDSEDFKMLRKESVKLTESEIIDLIEKIVLEQKEENKVKSNIKTTERPKGLSAYERAVKGSKKENDDYIKSVGKKMKDYLKDGSKGEYTESPKHFPKNNGQLEKMKKMAYEVSKDGEDFIDSYMRPGMENLDYDEIHPNEDWMKDNIEGSSRTGNNPEWGNAEETDLGVKLNKKRKENKLAKATRASYNKASQPVISDKPGQESGTGLKIKTESIETNTDKKLNEEFEKMKSLISYDRKTQ